MNSFTLVRPRTIDEAVREAAKPNTELKAGGVDLVDRMKEGLDAPATVVSLSDIPGRDGIAAGPPARIGSMATLARIAADDGLRAKYPALATFWKGRAMPADRVMFRITPARVRAWGFD